jgi:hypothetical protein
VYERHTADAGLANLHGLRHRYAEVPYEKLTGWKAPAAVGLTFRALSHQQRSVDRHARLTVSRELGHEREAVTVVYLGRCFAKVDSSRASIRSDAGKYAVTNDSGLFGKR